jgi:SGNH hydrolase-like domain, acetyltransferase AlgX
MMPALQRGFVLPKSTRSRLLGWLAYLVFLLVVVEVSLQGFYYVAAGDFLFRRVALPIFAREPHAGFGVRPGLAFHHQTNEFRAHYDVNQAGFRVPRAGVEYAIEKPADTYRIMLLGPSFAFGWAVDYEQSFAAILPRLLRERGFAGGKKIELIDAGVPALPVATQIKWFEAVGKSYAPDLVIQFLYGSMAVPDLAEPFDTVDDNGYLVSKTSSAGLRWRERLKSFATVFYGWLVVRRLHERLLPAQRGEGNALLGAGRPISGGLTFDLASPMTQEAMQVYERIAGAVRACGARLQLVYFPLGFAVHPEDESRWRDQGMPDVARQMAFDAAFVRYLNERQIPAIDITRPLQAAATNGRLYYRVDVHWTPAGNAVAASAVAEALAPRP